MVSMTLILDRRVRDSNGHMHVSDCVITRGMVSHYLAREIEGAVERGYDPRDLVPVFRDSSVLKDSLDSFRDIPLTRQHHADLSADKPYKEDVIGTVSNPRMIGDDVVADLTFWSAEDGIDPVLADRINNLSCGYVSGIEWTSGEHNGLHYVARMNKLSANHVALVSKGRVPGARVADQQPSESLMKSKFPGIIAALASVFNLKPEQATVLDTALNAELGGTQEVTIKVDAEQITADAAAKIEADRLAAEQVVADATIKAEADKVTLDAAISTAVAAAEARIHALYKAREAVSNKVGVTALDSAEATYRFALDKSGVTHTAIVADALPALWEATNKLVVQDSALPIVDVSKVFLSHIRKG